MLKTRGKSQPSFQTKILTCACASPPHPPPPLHSYATSRDLSAPQTHVNALLLYSHVYVWTNSRCWRCKCQIDFQMQCWVSTCVFVYASVYI